MLTHGQLKKGKKDQVQFSSESGQNIGKKGKFKLDYKATGNTIPAHRVLESICDEENPQQEYDGEADVSGVNQNKITHDGNSPSRGILDDTANDEKKQAEGGSIDPQTNEQTETNKEEAEMERLKHVRVDRFGQEIVSRT